MKSAHDAGSYCDAIARTGEVTSMDDVFHAAIERVGVVRVYSFSNLFSAAKILSSDRRVNGTGLAIISNGRGPAMMATDRLEHNGLQLAELSDDTLAKLREVLPEVRARNPLIIDGGVDTAERFRKVAEVLRDSKCVDAVLTVYAPDPRDNALDIASGVAEVPRPRGKPILTCWMGEQDVAGSRALFQSRGVPTFRTPEAAIDAFRFLCDHHRNQKLLLQVPYPLSKSAPPDREGARALIHRALDEGRRTLSQLESIELLRAFNIPTTRAMVAHDADEAAQAAASIGYPVALKIDSPNIGYKSEVDGVRLHIRDEAALRREYADMLARVHQLRPDAELHGALVEEMLDRPQGRELMIRISDDPVFGPVIKFAAGGGLPPERGERAIALPPLNRVLADDLIDKSRASRLLQPYRNLKAADRGALRRVLLRVSEMICELPELFELTINPLVVDADGAVAVDVQAVIERRDGAPNYSHMAIHPYPTEWIRVDTLKNDKPVEFRPIRPEDAEQEAEFVRGLSSESKYFRFMHAVEQLTPEMLSKFTKIDYDREMAFVALAENDDGEEIIVGVSRYVINPDWESCEFAVAIADDWKGVGLASKLMRLLIEHARFRGLKMMEGTVLKNNNNMAGLMAGLGFTPALDPDDHDILSYTLPLVAPQAAA
jgi:acetyltransferase